MDMFERQFDEQKKKDAPLAARMRPAALHGRTLCFQISATLSTRLKRKTDTSENAHIMAKRSVTIFLCL